MSETDKTPPPRRTIAVTIVGVLLLVPAATSAYMAAVFATSGDLQREFAGALGPSIVPYGFLLPAGVGVVVALIFGGAGVAIIRRWRGWRIWVGTLAWILIVGVVLKLFARSPPPGTATSRALVADLFTIAFAVFALVAKRRERKPDLAAVFDD